MELLHDQSLKPFNTFGIDAATKLLATANSIDDLQELITYSSSSGNEILFLGGGSNILFTKDHNGLTVVIRTKGISLVNEDQDFYYVEAAAGEVWHELVTFCIRNNYSGIENLSLIPGNAGAAPMQNIGAYGVELKDVFHELKALNRHTLGIETFSAEDCQFGYRESIFKRKEKGNYVIVSIGLKLRKKPVYNISYGAIEKELEAMGIKDLSIAAISQAVINIRRSKLPDPAVTGNAGSFFKNPEINASVHNELIKEFPGLVSYPLDNGNYKLAAGWLIESCGWKGQTLGNAGVHKLQALVLINLGNAKGQEIWDLSEKIVESVKKKFGIELEREVNIF